MRRQMATALGFDPLDRPASRALPRRYGSVDVVADPFLEEAEGRSLLTADKPVVDNGLNRALHALLEWFLPNL